MEEAGQGEESEQTENAEQTEPNDPNAPTPLDMEDSLRHSLADVRFMGIRDHHVMRGSDEIISFAKLLMRWSHNSFYIVSYCAGLLEPKERSGDKSKYAMRLRIAKKIAARTTPREPLEGEGADAVKNNREIVVTLADCKQDRSLRTFPLFCNHFNLLYFDIAEVEAMERRFPEILLVDPAIQSQDPLFTTTRENLNRIAPLALYHWHCIIGSFGRSVDYIDDTQDIPDCLAERREESLRKVAWKLNGGLHYPSIKFKKFLELPEECASPTLPYVMPEKFKRSRSNDIREYTSLIASLENMGIEDVRNRARIIYSSFPQLNHGNIGRMLPADPDAQTSKESDRDRGRLLLGLK